MQKTIKVLNGKYSVGDVYSNGLVDITLNEAALGLDDILINKCSHNDNLILNIITLLSDNTETTKAFRNTYERISESYKKHDVVISEDVARFCDFYATLMAKSLPSNFELAATANVMQLFDTLEH